MKEPIKEESKKEELVKEEPPKEEILPEGEPVKEEPEKQPIEVTRQDSRWFRAVEAYTNKLRVRQGQTEEIEEKQKEEKKREHFSLRLWQKNNTSNLVDFTFIGKDKALLSSSYYLHEKAEESRHNESMCFMIAILGSVFMAKGITQTLLTGQRPEWFLIFPYHIGSSANNFMGLAFTLLGTMLLLGGVVLAVHHRAQRRWYSNTLKEENRIKQEKARAQKRPEDKILPRVVVVATAPPRKLTREMNPPSNILEPKAESPEAS